MRGAESIRSLVVQGPGVRSVAGIERLQVLHELQLERLTSPDLHRLAALPHLRILVLLRLSGHVLYEDLSRLPELRRLTIEVDSRDAASAVARIDFAPLRRLTHLSLYGDFGGSIRMGLEWHPLPELEWLDIGGLGLSDEDLERLIAAPGKIRHLGFAPASPGQVERAREALGPRVSIAHHGARTAPLGVIVEDRDNDGHTFYELGLDLAGRVSTLSNIDAEIALRELLEAEFPDVASRLRFDTESSAVWIRSRNRDDLVRVQEIAARLDRRG